MKMFGFSIEREDRTEYQAFSDAMNRIVSEAKEESHKAYAFYDVCAHESWARKTLFKKSPEE